jgi:hypothetical protein
MRPLVEAMGRRRATPLHIVDFGSATGKFSLPLAALFPQCRFTLVDMKTKPVEIARCQAQAAGLDNVDTVVSLIEAYEENFDIVSPLTGGGEAVRGRGAGSFVSVNKDRSVLGIALCRDRCQRPMSGHGDARLRERERLRAAAELPARGGVCAVPVLHRPTPPLRLGQRPGVSRAREEDHQEG